MAIQKCRRCGRVFTPGPPDPALMEMCPECHSDRKSTRLNSSHLGISYAVFCLKKTRLHRALSPARASGRRVLGGTSIGCGFAIASEIRPSHGGRVCYALLVPNDFFFFLKDGAPPKTHPFPQPPPFPP